MQWLQLLSLSIFYIKSLAYSVYSPATSVVWTQGQTYAISWDIAFASASSVTIQLWDASYNDELIQVISANTANDGSFLWTIPLTLTKNPDDRRIQYIFIEELGCTFCSDISSNYFTLARSNGVIDNGCTYSSSFSPINSNCLEPEFWQNPGNISGSVTCYGLQGSSITFYIYRQIGFYPDASGIISTFTPSSDIYSFPFAFSIVSTTLQNCDPTQRFYLFLDGPSTQNYPSCFFLPTNTNLQCNRITHPDATPSLAIGPPSYISWEFQDDHNWNEWSLEFYLFREASYFPDPWWYLGSSPALDRYKSFQTSTLGISVDPSVKWYVQSYYRRFQFFTFPVANSPLFAVQDYNPNDEFCSFSANPTNLVLTCCSSTSTTNDLCRLATKSDVQIVVRDLQFFFEYAPDMCNTGLTVQVTPGITWVFNQNAGSLFKSSPFQISGLTVGDIVRQNLFTQPVFDTGMLPSLPPGDILGATADLELRVTCSNNTIGLSVVLAGAVNVAKYPAYEKDLLTIWEKPVFPLPTGPSSTSNAPTNAPTSSSTPTPCNQHFDCPLNSYCDSAHDCFMCSYINPTRCDAVDGSCCSQDFRYNCPSNPSSCCAATQVPRSDKSSFGSIIGNLGQNVTVTCNSGSYPSGNATTVICQANGFFSNFSCIGQFCSSTQIPHSDKSAPFAINGSLDVIIPVTCDAGYGSGLNTQGYVMCLASGSFSSFRCDPRPCMSTQIADSDKFIFGSINGSTGDSVRVVCDPGYSINGTVNSSTVCQASGSFTPAQCIANDCLFTQVPNSNRAAPGSVTGTTGTTVAVTCSPGFSFAGQSSGAMVCQPSGSFTPFECLATNSLAPSSLSLAPTTKPGAQQLSGVSIFAPRHAVLLALVGFI